MQNRVTYSCNQDNFAMNDLYANPPQMLNHVRNVIAARTGTMLSHSIESCHELHNQLTCR